MYKTAHHERFTNDYKDRVVDVALATSAAPTYFPTHRSAAGIPLVDGGFWANNPSGLSAVEAVGVLGWPKDEVKILSVGCTTEPINIKLARYLPMGKAYWGFRAVNLFMHAQSSASQGATQLLIGKDNLVRVDPVVANGKFGLDVTSEIASLKGLGEAEAREAMPSITNFFAEKAEKFEPLHML